MKPTAVCIRLAADPPLRNNRRQHSSRLQVESSSITTRNGAIQREMQDAYRKLICANVERKVRTRPRHEQPRHERRITGGDMFWFVFNERSPSRTDDHRITGGRVYWFV